MKLVCVRLVLVAACSLSLALTARAGSVITTNLPAGTSIVNIDAQQDGAASYSQPNPPQAFWYQPTKTAPSLTLGPGTYQFSIIDPADAHTEFPDLTDSQQGQIYTAWTYNSPWSENYLVFDSAAVADSTLSQLFDGAIAPGNPGDNTFATPQLAYDGTVADGYYDLIRPAPPGRAGTAADYVPTYTFTTTTTLLFVIPDNALGDNGGGVSVVVTSVPEPSTLALGVAGVSALLAVAARRRRSKKR